MFSPLPADTVTDKLKYPICQNHTVLFHPEDSDELYVGGTDFVLKIDVDGDSIIEEFTLKTKDQQDCSEGLCENVITVIQKFQDSLFVCGTNGHKPQCWKLYCQVNNQSGEIVKSYEGIGISPYVYTQNSLSLTVEGDLYAAAPLDNDGSSLQFRRKAGNRTNVWMYDKWVLEPTFVSASWVKRQEDPDNEKIYVFFREKNSDTSPEADPLISRVARVCKVDEGGSKRFFQNMWTSFLKARFVCGFQKESLYYNNLQDVFVLHAENWTDTRVYALFSSSWNSTAVCIYSMADVDRLFETSDFKGYNKEIPNPRPGTCVKNSRSLPSDTVTVVKDHPEMTDWIYPTQALAPFYTSSDNYTKIAVDRVQAADQRIYNVLLLATDSGKIHKVLEDGPAPFIISETQLTNRTSIIQSMKLDSKKRKLVVSFSEQITSMDLQRCQHYNGSCQECVLARDPYCAWTKSGCQATIRGAIQDIAEGQTNVCLKAVHDPKVLDRSPQEPPREVYSVPLNVPFYLSCPIDSHHAVYTWIHQGQRYTCLQMQSNCLHLIPAVGQNSYGNYTCESEERNYTKVVKEYQLDRQIQTVLDTNLYMPKTKIPFGSAATYMPQVDFLMSMVTVVIVMAL